MSFKEQNLFYLLQILNFLVLNELAVSLYAEKQAQKQTSTEKLRADFSVRVCKTQCNL